MRVAVSGLSGCGNTTVSGLVAKRLGFDNINYTFRNLAKDRGISFEEMCALAGEDDSVDLELDRKQVGLALSKENCVLASRLAIWVLKEADLRFYIDVSLEERARRIWKREGGRFEDRLRETIGRDERDSRRYARIYGIDNTKPEGVADLVIKGDSLDAEAVAGVIEDRIRAEMA